VQVPWLRASNDVQLSEACMVSSKELAVVMAGMAARASEPYLRDVVLEVARTRADIHKANAAHSSNIRRQNRTEQNKTRTEQNRTEQSCHL
jgi:hypothetical protein